MSHSEPAAERGVLTLTGAVLGGVIGYLLRPSGFLVGPLPWRVVLTRGADLEGADRLLVGLARQSFNDVLAGVLLGAAAGLVVALLLVRRSR